MQAHLQAFETATREAAARVLTAANEQANATTLATHKLRCQMSTLSNHGEELWKENKTLLEDNEKLEADAASLRVQVAQLRKEKAECEKARQDEAKKLQDDNQNLQEEAAELERTVKRLAEDKADFHQCMAKTQENMDMTYGRIVARNSSHKSEKRGGASGTEKLGAHERPAAEKKQRAC